MKRSKLGANPLINHDEDREVEKNKDQDFIQCVPSIVSKSFNQNLVRPIEEEKLVEENWDLDPDKAQGLDVFFISFYRDF